MGFGLCRYVATSQIPCCRIVHLCFEILHKYPVIMTCFHYVPQKYIFSCSLIGFSVKPSQTGNDCGQSPQMLFMNAICKTLFDNSFVPANINRFGVLRCFEDYINASGICCAVVAVVVVFKKTSRGWRHERMHFISTFKSKPLFRCHTRRTRSRCWSSHHGAQSWC